jgi:Cu/Ag efflux protein CusF
MKKLVMTFASFMFVMGLALTSFAAREIVEGKAEKVDAMKGSITVVTKAGPRAFTVRQPEKLKEVKDGDNVKLTIQEDGDMVIEKAK